MKKINLFLIFCSILIILISSISFGSLTDKLSVYYGMNGYSTENENDLFGIYNLTQTGNPANVTGIKNTARNFPDNSDYMKTPNNFTLVGTGNFTISFWIKLNGAIDGTKSARYICSHDDSRTTGFCIMNCDTTNCDGSSGNPPGNTLSYTTNTGYAFHTTPLVAGRWTHLTYIRLENTSVEVYVNGLMNNSRKMTAATNINTYSSTGFGIGTSSANYGNFDMDEIAFWNRTLTPQEINQTYNNGTGYTFSLDAIININSVNITAQYLGGKNSTDYAYWDAQNITCAANITSGTNTTYDWNKNGVLYLTNNSFLTNNNYTNNDNLTCVVNTYNGSYSAISSRTYTILSNAFNIASTGNNWNINNLSVINGLKYNLSLNINFAQSNLFATFINVICDINGSIFNATNTSINTKSLQYNISNISLNYPMQRCRIYITSSDDHTANEIDKYTVLKQDNTITFDTKTSVIDIIAQDEVSNINTQKLIDRETFAFSYPSKSLSHTYTVHSDNKLYYRENSKYNGHFISWNDATHTGNWIDFNTETQDKEYTIEKIDDYTYDVVVSDIVPQDVEIVPEKTWLFGELRTVEEQTIEDFGSNNIQFESLGDTNIYNATFYFYIGGEGNISLLNLYDNYNMSNYSIKLNTITGYPPLNNIYNTTGNSILLDNITNGTYNILVESPHFFTVNRTLIINNNLSQYIAYNTSEAQLNINIENVVINTLVYFFNLTMVNTATGNANTYNSNGQNSISIPLNASTYNYNISGAGYLTRTGTMTLAYKENKTLTEYLGFNANFTIFDEDTGLPFNMGDANSKRLYIFCPVQTLIFNLSSAYSFFIPVECTYTKFRLEMVFDETPGETIYRTYIIPTNALNNVNVYFANGHTTELQFMAFQIDDMLNSIPNTGIYVRKYINLTNTVITADFIDVENKITTYLIQSNDYIIDLYSNGVFVKTIGTYTADVSGFKTLRVFSLDMGPVEGTSISKDVWYDNSTTTAYGHFKDTTNTVTTVSFIVTRDSINGTILNNQTILNPTDIQFNYNVGALSGLNLYAKFIYTTTDGTVYSSGKAIKEDNTILFPLATILGPQIMTLFILTLLIIFSIFSTFSSAPIVSIIICVLSVAFLTFGWFNINPALLAVVFIINIISLLRRINKESV